MTISAVDLFPITGDFRSITEPVSSGNTNVPPVQIVSALVDFSPRIPRGFQFYLPAYQVEGANALIMLGWVGLGTSGTWTFAFGGQTATGLTYNITASALQTALRALSSIGAGNVTVTTVTGTSDISEGWYLEFTGALANTPIAASAITIDNTSVVGGSIHPFVTTPGQAIAYRDTSLVLDPVFNARVWDGQLSTINASDTPGCQLPACTPDMQANLTAAGIDSLIYDVRFTQVTYARADNALQNFAFVAPADAGTPVCITDPTLMRLGYRSPTADITTKIEINRVPKRVAVVDDALTFYDASNVALPDPIPVADFPGSGGSSGGSGGTPDDLSVTFAKLAAALVVTSSETILTNNNNTTIPTSAAVTIAINAAITALGTLVDTTDGRLSDTRTPTDATVTFAKLAGALVVTSGETIASNNNDTTIPTSAAVTGAVNAGINALVNGAPGALNTLKELADAINDDASYAASITTALSGKQPLDADLTAIAALASAANKLPYATGTATWALTDLTAFARTFLDDADAATVIATLGAVATTDTRLSDTRTPTALSITTGMIQAATLVTAAETIAANDNDTTLPTSAAVQAAITAATIGGGGGITDVVDDTTPQLGGNLDPNGHTVGDATAADLTKLHALTGTSTQLNYVAGVTSAIQTQLDGKQASDTDLTAIAALVSAANKLPYATGAGTWALTDFSAFARTFLDDADAATVLATLGAVATGDSRLSDTRTPTDATVTFAKLNGALVVTSTETISANNNDTTVPTSAAVTAAIVSAVSALVGGAPGALDTLKELADAINDDASYAATITTALSGKQPLDADLTAIAALTSAANKMPYSTAANSWAMADLTAFARTFLDDADAATVMATLGGTTAATASTPALRNAQANLLADAFIPSVTSTATAAGTTALDVNSTEVQIFTGTTTQVVSLPTTSVVAGQRFTINNQSTGVITVNASGGATVVTLSQGQSVTVIALQATPTTNAHWGAAFTTAVAASAASAVSTLLQRDGNANAAANIFIADLTSTATAAGTTALAVTSDQNQIFTGTTTQTCTLPTTGVAAGHTHLIVNKSTGVVTVNSSAGNLVATLAAGQTVTVIALQATPTAATHWWAMTSGVGLAADGNNNLTLDAFIANATSITTAAGTTTLTINDTQTQVFTGTSTQTVKLPTTSVVAGMPYTMVNNSTGIVTVQSSAGNTITTVAPSSTCTLTAQIATPTAAAHWSIVPTITGSQRFVVVTSIPGTPDPNTVYIVNDAGAPRVVSLTSTATPAINTDAVDVVVIPALAVAITSMTSGLTGTAHDGQKILIRITGTAARAITWGTSFQSSGVATLLATTSGTNTHNVLLVYDAVDLKWTCMAVDPVGY